jgi:hypothetical protein
MAGFYEFVGGLRARVLATSGPEQPIVSGQYLKYSRFWETATGDRVRSALRGRCGSRLPVRLS